MTALPNANAEAAGGLYTRGTGAGQINQDANGRVDARVAAYASGQAPLQPTVAGRTLDVSAGGEAGLDWANIGSPTTVQGLSGTTVKDATDVHTDVTTLVSRLTSARAGYLDNLNVGGNVASSAETTAIQNNTRVVRVVPDVIERPDSGTTTFRIELYLYDSVGNMEAPDSAPTMTLVNQAGTDLSARLSSTTMSLVSTGVYRVTYTASVGDALEQLVFGFSVVEGGATRLYANTSLIVDTTAVDFTATDRTKLNQLATDYTTTRAGYLDNLSGGAVALHADVTPTALAAGVLDATASSHNTAGTIGEKINSGGGGGGGGASAADVVAALMAFAHDSGVTVEGLFKRLEALVSGKASGMNSNGTVTFYLRDGVSVAFSAVQSVTHGTRNMADVTGSE
jgi:hypothetical protein